jgi:predicted transcriptional regulator
MSLRLDPALKSELRTLAARNHRSLNEEAAVAIEQHVARPAEIGLETRVTS